MKTVRRDYSYNGTTYQGTITYKRMKSMTLRFDAEHSSLRVSCPTWTPISDIDRFVFKYLPKLSARSSKKKPVYDGRFLYVFGSPEEVGELQPTEVNSYLKKAGMPYLKERVAHYEALMGVKESYKIRMRDMKRTFGSNSRRTKTLTFQIRMMAFPKEIIDSVIVHELAHHFQFDHSKKFYDIVYRYCPDYKALRKRLIHDQFAS